MATMTTERMTVNAPPSATKEAMGAVIEARAAERTIGDRIRSAPAALRGWLREVFRWTRLNAVGERVRPVTERAKAILRPVLGPIIAAGPWFITGALLTAHGGRRLLRGALATTYQVASAPVRWLARGLGWLGRKIGMGGAVDRVESYYDRATSWVAVRIDAAEDWMDRHENYDVMALLRSIFQGGILARLIRRYAPARAHGVLYFAAFFVPAFGVGKENNTENRLTLVKGFGEKASAEVRKTEKKDKAKATEQASAQAVESDAPPAGAAATNVAEVYRTVPAVVVGTGKKVLVREYTKADGTVYYKYGNQNFEPGKLPSHLRLVTANAETMPEPPAPNREARREQERQAKREEKAAAKAGMTPTPGPADESGQAPKTA